MHVPDRWKKTKLSNLSEKRISNGAFNDPKKVGSGYRLINVVNLYTPRHINIEALTLLELTDKEFINFQVKKNDLFFTRSSLKLEGIAHCNIFDKEDDNVVYECHIMRVRPIYAKVNAKYLLEYCQSHVARKHFMSHAKTGTMTTIDQSGVGNLDVLLPPLPEQQKIAQILSTWDKAIEKLEALIAAKQKRKKALMQQLLTGKKRFAGFEGDWEEYKLGEITDKRKKWSFTGGPFGSNLKAQDYTESGVRIIQLQNIGDGLFHDNYKIYTSTKKADELLSCNIYPGEIIISKMGDPVARACFIPNSSDRFLMASDGIRLAVDEEKFNKKFIHDYINHKIFRKKAISASTGSTRQRIGLDDLRKLTLLVPTLSEQQKIASVLSAADKEIETHQSQLYALKQQKKGLMQQLLTGKKRVKLEKAA